MVFHDYCKADSDLKTLFTECFYAYKHFVFESSPKYFKRSVTQNYVGLFSGLNSSKWERSILLTLTFSENTIEGKYHIAGATESSQKVVGKIDSKGHLFLQEILGEKNGCVGCINYEFKGILRDHTIQGLWVKGRGKKVFAFFAMEEKNSLLLRAVSVGEHEIVELLLSKGENVNVSDIEGNTALHIAVLHNYKNVVKTLLSHDVEVNKQNSKGQTPLQIAIENNFRELIELLEQYGAKE